MNIRYFKCQVYPQIISIHSKSFASLKVTSFTQIILLGNDDTFSNSRSMSKYVTSTLRYPEEDHSYFIKG